MKREPRPGTYRCRWRRAGKLEGAAEGAGANTKYSSVEAAQALENLAKAGLSASQAVTALPAVLALAQAGDVSLAESASYVARTVAGMGVVVTPAVSPMCSPRALTR